MVRRHGVYRTRHALRFAVTVWGLIVFGCLLDGLLSANSSAWAWDGGSVALVTAGMLLAGRLGVRADPDGVRIVRLFRTARFRWDEIERFELAPVGVYPFAGHAILKSGRDIPILSITVPRFFTERIKPRAQEPIDELNALLCAAREHQDDSVRSSTVVHDSAASLVAADLPSRTDEQRLRRTVYALAVGQASVIWVVAIVNIALLHTKNEALLIALATVATVLGFAATVVLRMHLSRKNSERQDAPRSTV